MSPEEREFLCDGWAWDAVLRELRHYRPKGKKWEEQPDAAETLKPVQSVTWHRWSQAPMATATGQAMPTRLSRIVAAYEGGGDLTINENDRDCAEKLAGAIAEAFGLTVVTSGAPGGPKAGTVPAPDEMGRLRYSTRGYEVVLDVVSGEIVEVKQRFPLRRVRRRLPLAEVRRLELEYGVNGPLETFTLYAVAGPEEERFPFASYDGYEGWADPAEWREFARGLARRLGVPVSGAD
ncbi:MAG TPA: hypothetical protein VFT91_04815 [Dehalococcoidia bacterium]|nr:hypothetical protein [Dehalococcoidia bacterium]